jgi:hypothetical protein
VTEPNLKLVADLARLVAKYPAEEWNGLADFLRNPDSVATMADLADRLGSASRSRAKRSAHAARLPGVREALKFLRSKDPAQADVLEDMWIRLRRRELMPEMRSVRVFAEAIGLKALEATRREQAVAEVMRHVLDLPPEQLAAALRHASAPDRVLSEEYGRWVDLILGRDLGQPAELQVSPAGVAES